MTPQENIRILKLSTGETLIGMVMNEDETHLNVVFPHLIRVFPSIASTGQITDHNSLSPWLPYTIDEAFTLSKSHIMINKQANNTSLIAYLHNINNIAQINDTIESLPPIENVTNFNLH